MARSAFDLALAGFAPGGYTLVSRVADEVSGESRELSAPVDIVRP